MKVLLFEYVTGGGLAAETLPPPLAREGELMAGALLRDFAELPGIRLSVLRDARLPLPAAAAAGIRCTTVGPAADLDAAFAAAVAAADAIWPIAPETGGLLERLCQQVETAGRRLLTSPAAAVRLAASKLATVRRLSAHNIPVVATTPVHPARPPAAWPVVVKPDDGCGCEGARLIESAAAWWDESHSFRPGDLVQPLRTGASLSLSAVFAAGAARLLSVNRQHVAQAGGRFALTGCTVNALPDTDGRFQSLVERIAEALPELWGYAGVDLILGAEGPEILEINPRLTTSAAGLHPALGFNLARSILKLARSGCLPPAPAPSGRAITLSLEPGHGH